MSQGNAAAIRRRVKNTEQPPSKLGTNSESKQPSTLSTNSNLSISDAFKMVNERLVNLEKSISGSSDINQTESIKY